MCEAEHVISNPVSLTRSIFEAFDTILLIGFIVGFSMINVFNLVSCPDELSTLVNRGTLYRFKYSILFGKFSDFNEDASRNVRLATSSDNLRVSKFRTLVGRTIPFIDVPLISTFLISGELSNRKLPLNCEQFDKFTLFK